MPRPGAAAPHLRSARACRCGSAAQAQRARPVLALQPQAASAGCARGHCLSSPQPSRAPHRYAPSSPPAATRLPCAAGGAAFSSPPSPPQGRYPARYAVSAAVGGPVNAACGQVAPASCWAASSFNSPVGPRNEPSLRFGLLALAPSAPKGLKVCSRLRPLHGFFQCFRPGRGEYSHTSEPVKGTPRYARWLRHP